MVKIIMMIEKKSRRHKSTGTILAMRIKYNKARKNARKKVEI